MAARGHRVIVLGADDVVAMIQREHSQNCEQLARPSRWLGPLQGRALVKKARAAGVDIVHLNYVRPEQEAWLLPDAPPFIATAWGSDVNEHDFPRPESYTRRVDNILRGASAVTGDSVPMIGRLRTRMAGETSPEPELVMWGVDTELFAADRHRKRAGELRLGLGIADDELCLLSPRQNTSNYHTDRIIAAFARSTWPAKGVLVIKLHGRAGQGERRHKLIHHALEAGVAERVRFAGKYTYEDLPAVYAMADAAVSALEADGVPSTFCELMALGVPIVATDLDSYEGVLDEGRGMLVPPADVDAMAAAFDQLAESAELRASFARKGREHAVSALSWERSVTRWEQLYYDALTTASKAESNV